jgi:DNA replication protein DnaC
MTATTTDTAALAPLLTALRLPSIARHWPAYAETADREGWPAARLLATLFELEIADRADRRIKRHFQESGLPPGKTFATLDLAAVPGVRPGQLRALAAGDRWITAGSNLLAFGPSGTGKTHAACAVGAALIDAGFRVLFTRTTDMVQRLQTARRDLVLTQALDKLDRFDLIILDDLSYVRKDQVESSVLFELINHRYERRSLLITANQPFSAWTQVFPDAAMTVAAVDRLVHHATILEMNGESYRRRSALTNGSTDNYRSNTHRHDRIEPAQSHDDRVNPHAALEND